jgi:type II secretory pathway component PulM
MTLSARDQKLLGLWVAMVTLGVGYWFFWPENSTSVVPTAQRRNP